jgi:hypothetical protein
MRARLVMMRMRRKSNRTPTIDELRRMKHRKWTMDQRRMWRTEGIVEPVMSMGWRARMATMRMRRKKHRKPTMDQHEMWRTEGIVLESVKIGLYISDL